MDYLYLHGFASGPRSKKGRFLQAQFQNLGISLKMLDLNQPSFETLTVTSQLAVLEANLSEEPATLLGSSFGGLLAVLQAIRDSRIEKLVLMAPALQFIKGWQKDLGEATIALWRATGQMPVYHYGYGMERNLKPDILDDAALYDENQLTRPIPTLILHGHQDTVIPVERSQIFAQNRPYVNLKIFETDHSMESVLEPLWHEVATFCGLPPSQ
ncbi:MAG: esterase [Anaerolineae bacterium]|nr:esterase [Gloeobacterales cyanobacterium ES-bin-313]